MWASGINGILDNINKGKRKQLTKYLKQIELTKDSRLYSEITPKGARKDKGTLFFFISTKSRVKGQERELHAIIDVLTEDGQEEFMEYISNHDEVAALLMEGKEEDNLPTYNPETHCLYPKSAFGRPRAALSEEEKKQIMELRAAGVGYNKIAAKLHRNNHVIIKYCKQFLE